MGLEDVATNALFFILSHSTSARSAFSDFLGDDGIPLPIAKVEPWAADAHGAVPDMVCRDENDNQVAFIEAKFWAPLTHHQPVTYWKALPCDRPAVLLFLVPDDRIAPSSLWDKLVDRLRDAGHELRFADRRESLLTAPSKVCQRRLMLTSWQLLLDRMAQRTKEDGDTQACFEIAELQGLADDAIAGDNPRRPDNLKLLIADAVKRVEQSGWANTDGLSAGGGFDYYARYLRLAGASAGLRIDYGAVKQTPDKLLWLWFYRDLYASISVEVVGSTLGKLEETELEWRSGELYLPIILPVAADRDAILNSIVSELERIAQRIDPNGPTYREAC